MIILEQCPIRRCHQRKRSRETRHYDAMGYRARRNGVILATTSSHERQWISIERAKRALARDWPGEEILVAESEAAE